MNYNFLCNDSQKIRLIVDTDAKNEADDQYAIVHQALTPKFDIVGYIAAHFENKHGEGQKKSMMKSYEELELVFRLMGMGKKFPIYKGAERAMVSADEPIVSEGANFIVREAMREDERPLFVVFQGAITDLAAAYLIEPRIADRMTAVWIGGGEYPVGEWEFNLSQDIIAANVVFSSKLNLWQIPISSYRFVRTSMSELQYKVKPYGAIGEYLFTQMISCHMARATDATFSEGNAESFIYPFDNYPLETWCLGDSPLVGLMLDSHSCNYEYIPAPNVTEDMFYIHNTGNRPIRVYKYIDSNLTMEDFFAKMQLNYGENRGSGK